MIAQLTQQTQYGKQGTIGINLLSELSEDPITFAAHSVQDAVEWALSYPLFQDAEVEKFERIVTINSKWQPRVKSAFEEAGLIEWENGIEKAEFARAQMIIKEINTIYENTGFQGFRK
jgi:hypothetical protein